MSASEDTLVDVEITVDGDISEYDQAWLDAMCAFRAVIGALEAALEAEERGILEEVTTEEHVEALAAAFHTGERLLECDDDVKHDLAQAPDEVLEELDANLAPVGESFGITVNVPLTEET